MTTFQFKKYRDKVNNLQVYCSMKERGCGWSGTLEQLDTHLDPHQDNCQYVDTKCPLNCLKTIPKNNLDDHLAQHCVKRAYVCRHCSFKATYEEVVDTHLPQCKYVPLDCPNRCGATFERDFLEDHMKMCRLEQVECELRGVGCGGRFLREDQEEHARQNSQKHLTLTASLVVETKEQLQQKLLELDQRHKEEEEKLKKKIEEQEKKLGEQEKLSQLEKKQLEGKLLEFSTRFQDFEKRMSTILFCDRTFEMKNFSVHREKDQFGDWRSPPMYTHFRGYKFCIGVDANGCGAGHGRFINIDLCVLPGEFDDQLKWPARAKMKLALIHQDGGCNVSSRVERQWNKPSGARIVGSFNDYGCGFLSHVLLSSFLSDNDSLYFSVSDVKLC